jgi:3-phosphoshikimate 1-carboxyvinyltransferase
MPDPNPEFPEALAIQPLERPPCAEIRVPGSKSITNRALVLAALSDPEQGSEVQGALQSEDTEVMVDCLRSLGFRVQVDWPEEKIKVRRGNHVSPIPATEADLFVGNSGTSMRFLTALVGLGHGRYRLDGVSRMRERPIADLLAALQQMGVNAYSERQNGYPPVIVEADGLAGGTARIRGETSSQFLSGLLLAAPLAAADTSIEVEGTLVSQPYVNMTLWMMRRFGAPVESEGPCRFYVPHRSWYDSTRLAVEPDASAASYFLAAAAITRGEVSVPGIRWNSLQGDVRFLFLLQRMGCQTVQYDDRLTVIGSGLQGIHADMNAMSDCVMTLAAVACFAQGPTTIRNVAHIRHKETDRLHAMATELTRIGAQVEELPDGLTITPGPLHGGEIETYDDHRIAMSMALIGLVIPGIVIKNPGCVSKTYPRFFEDLEKLRGHAPSGGS